MVEMQNLVPMEGVIAKDDNLEDARPKRSLNIVGCGILILQATNQKMNINILLNS